ncbi:hypothetical protein CEK26_006162 [Fusarium fujikuroi]|uniref:Uncharacterized protein n=1 Tax=Fusarium fujikuroi TaxID=5127 RepID=A0A0J0A896_FUSFU|nr:Uncharacterized protein LW93_2060 [Fusarium fujikuroi]KLO98881.1 Uncharacterized protein Y057_3974 [Fusarium fujikuroi]KLP15886.1 Uncharacterized protein LW94_1585 [Fusarium fujikuroi]QGI62197.1 hypothetical protein CEK27_006168 [Fusarium fujikuroi]QGI79368.1 hypothetical protein CEK25_006097 [Fusarium fujikuroi]
MALATNYPARPPDSPFRAIMLSSWILEIVKTHQPPLTLIRHLVSAVLVADRPMVAQAVHCCAESDDETVSLVKSPMRSRSALAALPNSVASLVSEGRIGLCPRVVRKFEDQTPN